MDTVLSVKNIEKYYGNRSNMVKAIDGISFDVVKGEYIGIMGASGSGKTTLLNAISTVDTISAGSIIVDGKDITNLRNSELATFRREKLGFIFQDFNLLDTLTGFENISLALSILKVPAKEVHERIETVAEQLNIKDIMQRYPYEMSGGQKQRIASARAIVTNPTLVLADEPTGSLDSRSSKMLLENFEALNTELGATILMVTHDAVVSSYCKRILFIKDGRIFNELIRGEDTRKQFFERIIQVVSLLGGDVDNVL